MTEYESYQEDPLHLQRPLPEQTQEEIFLYEFQYRMQKEIGRQPPESVSMKVLQQRDCLFTAAAPRFSHIRQAFPQATGRTVPRRYEPSGEKTYRFSTARYRLQWCRAVLR